MRAHTTRRPDLFALAARSAAGRRAADDVHEKVAARDGHSFCRAPRLASSQVSLFLALSLSRSRSLCVLASRQQMYAGSTPCSAVSIRSPAHKSSVLACPSRSPGCGCPQAGDPRRRCGGPQQGTERDSRVKSRPREPVRIPPCLLDRSSLRAHRWRRLLRLSLTLSQTHALSLSHKHTLIFMASLWAGRSTCTR